jgi:hypothetical protein
MGGDWIHADPSGKHLRLDVRSVLKYSLPPSPPPAANGGHRTDDDEVPH